MPLSARYWWICTHIHLRYSYQYRVMSVRTAESILDRSYKSPLEDFLSNCFIGSCDLASCFLLGPRLSVFLRWTDCKSFMLIAMLDWNKIKIKILQQYARRGRKVMHKSELRTETWNQICSLKFEAERCSLHYADCQLSQIEQE